MPTLYDLKDTYASLLQLMDDPEADEESLSGILQTINCEIEDKADNYAKILRELNGEEFSLAAEIDRLSAKKKALSNRADWLKSKLQDAMIACQKPKFKTALFSFNIQQNPPKLILDPEHKIPKKYLIPQDPKVDNTAIKEILKTGKKLPFAHLESTESLRIR